MSDTDAGVGDVILTYVLEYPGTHLVKIGQAKYFVDRFTQLTTGSPIKPVTVCVFRGAKHEHDLHKKFAHLNHHGEYYHYTKELENYLASDAMKPYRMTHDEARKLSPRIPRKVDKPKEIEMSEPLETDDP